MQRECQTNPLPTPPLERSLSVKEPYWEVLREERDFAWDADGGDRDAMLRQSKTSGVHQQMHGISDIVIVIQWLSHSLHISLHPCQQEMSNRP